jgi:UDP-glucose 4-epimerase
MVRNGTVLVTGGAGFIGSHLVELLVEARRHVVVLDDLSRGRREWLPHNAELLQLDIRDMAGVQTAVEQIAPDSVVHLAAMHFIPAVEGAPDLARDVNVEGTRSLLAALNGRPPELVLFASTAAVYPDREGPIAETCDPAPLELYGETKLEGEQLVAEFCRTTRTSFVAARLFNVVGPRETNPHVVPELVSQLQAGDGPVRLGNLETRRDYTDVRDVAAALHALAAAGRSGATVCNVGSGHGVSVEELVEVCREILGRPVEVQVDPTRRRARDRRELVADPGLLRTMTGWRPKITLRETLRDLLAEAL